jgi:ribonuclease P protein component
LEKEFCKKEGKKAAKSLQLNKMLSKENRLIKKTDFQRVFKLGKGFKSSFLYIKTVKGEANATRVGFVVSKEISNKAVERNKVKRLLRKAVSEYISFLPLNTDIVVVVLPEIKKSIKNIKGLKLEDIKEIVKKAFKK